MLTGWHTNSQLGNEMHSPQLEFVTFYFFNTESQLFFFNLIKEMWLKLT